MPSGKVALTVRKEVLLQAKKQVRAGRARSLSAFVTDALDEKLRRAELSAVLDVMDAEHGTPDKPAKAWTKRVLERSPPLPSFRSRGARVAVVNRAALHDPMEER